MGYIIDNKEWTNDPDVGIGIKFPFNGPGIFNTSYTTKDQAISNLKNLLLTMVGERILQPLYGTNLLGALFQPITPELKQFIMDDISDAIAYWLSYIDVINISVDTFEEDPSLESKVRVTLKFSVTQDGSESSVTIESDSTGGITFSENL